MCERGSRSGSQIAQQVLLEDFLTGGVVVGAGSPPGVVMRDEQQLVLRLPWDRKDIIPNPGSHRPTGKFLTVKYPSTKNPPLHPNQELLQLPLIVFLATFQVQNFAVGPNVIEDFCDPLVDRFVPGVNLVQQT